jgi:hypothetical protein
MTFINAMGKSTSIEMSALDARDLALTIIDTTIKKRPHDPEQLLIP